MRKISSAAKRVELIKKVRAPLNYMTKHSLNKTAGVIGIYVLLLSTCATDIQSGMLQRMKDTTNSLLSIKSGCYNEHTC